MNNIIKCLVVMLMLASSFFISTAYSATINAASCSVADITTAIASASNGDIVNVPSGSCNWSTTLTLNKSINLIGAGRGVGGTSITTTGADGYLLASAGTNNWRISGFSFSTANPDWIAIRVNLSSGTNTGWRIDHNKFTGYHFAIFGVDVNSSDSASSVVDHNEFYGGGVQFFGDNDRPNGPWTKTTRLGGKDFIFIEDNRFSDVGALTICTHAVATNDGARVVVRYNDFFIEDSSTNYGQWDIFDAHGYGHGEYVRAVRAYEIYNNTFTRSKVVNLSHTIYLRGGTGVVYNNRLDGVYTDGAIKMHEVRASTIGDTQLHSEMSPYCSTSPICQSSYVRLKVADDPYLLFSNGDVVTGASSGASGEVLKVTNGEGIFAIYFLSITGGPFTNGEDLKVGGVTLSTATANSEAMNGEGYPCCDQVGRGKDQADEPVFIWDNVDENGVSTTVGLNEAGDIPVFVEGRDYCTHDTSTPCNSVVVSYTAYEYPHPLTKPQPPGNLKVTSP